MTCRVTSSRARRLVAGRRRGTKRALTPVAHGQDDVGDLPGARVRGPGWRGGGHALPAPGLCLSQSSSGTEPLPGALAASNGIRSSGLVICSCGRHGKCIPSPSFPRTAPFRGSSPHCPSGSPPGHEQLTGVGLQEGSRCTSVLSICPQGLQLAP